LVMGGPGGPSRHYKRGEPAVTRLTRTRPWNDQRDNELGSIGAKKASSQASLGHARS
jgi:hypothetical protein